MERGTQHRDGDLIRVAITTDRPLYVDAIVGAVEKEMSSSPIDALTAREREVLELLVQGLSNRQIGQRLSLAEKTIKHYMTNILKKLRVRSRVEAALIAQKSGIGGSVLSDTK